MAEMGGRLVSTVEICEIWGDQADPVCLEKKQGANDSAVPESHQIGIPDASLVRGRPDRVGTTVSFDWKRAKNTPEKKGPLRKSEAR